MGLFDTIRCEHPLPDARTASASQTKSLGCGLGTHRLTASGRMLQARFRHAGMLQPQHLPVRYEEAP